MRVERKKSVERGGEKKSVPWRRLRLMPVAMRGRHWRLGRDAKGRLALCSGKKMWRVKVSGGLWIAGKWTEA
jgi:hypothetical protein